MGYYYRITPAVCWYCSLTLMLYINGLKGEKVLTHLSWTDMPNKQPNEGVSYHHTLIELTWITSQWAQFEDTRLAHRELTRWTHTVNLLWDFREFATHTVNSLLPLHGELIGMISRIAHSVSWKLTESSQQAHNVSHLVSSLWGNCVSSKWAHH